MIRVFGEIKVVKASDIVTARIKNAIIDGTFKPGMKLPSEHELGEQFSVSRTTIREALRNLQTAGLVSVKTGRDGGATILAINNQHLTNALSFLLEVNKTDIFELLEARRVLEVLCAGLAAERATPDQMEKLKTVVDNSCNKPLPLKNPEFDELNLEFHKLIAQSSHNKVFIYSLESVRSVVLKIAQGLIEDKETQEKSIVWHQMIYRGIMSKDKWAAEDAMRRHMESFETRVANLYNSL